MVWVEVFAAFGLCHLAGDYMLQTEWQAVHKFGGLGRDRNARRSLLLATHGAVDDGRAVHWYTRRIKGSDPLEHPGVTAALDQTLHVLLLFGFALLAVG
jgi:hypothetical protein